MVRGMVDYAKKHGADKVTVRINKDNIASNAIVKKMGFEVIDEKSYKKRGTELEFSDYLYELNISGKSSG